MRNFFFCILVFSVVLFSVFKSAKAAAPDPGHNFTEISGGVIQGNILYGSAADTLSALAKDATATRYLSNTGTTNNPAWAQVNLTNGVTGVLPAANGGGLGYTITVQALTSSPADGATVYFGAQPRAPGAVGLSKVYIRKAGTIKMANILAQSGTAGSNEAWTLNILVNNGTPTLIKTVSVSATERVFDNSALNIAVSAGDYVEIQAVYPTWPTTNPLTTVYGGYIYIE